MSETNTPQGTGPLTPGEAAGLLGGMLNDDAPEALPEEDAPVSEGAEETEAEFVEEDADVEEEADAEESEEATASPRPDEIEIDLPDGTRTKVTRDELTKGYLRQSDYTRKTQQLAEQAKEADARSQQEIAKIQEALQRIEQAFPEEKEPDWEKLAQDDPFEFSVQQARWTKRQKALTEAREQANKAMHEQVVKAQERFQEHVQNEISAVRAHPLFADAVDDKARSDRQEALFKTAQSLGFEADDFARVTDHRVYVMLEKARRYDEMISKAEKVEKAAPKAPKERRPGTARQGNPRSEAVSKSLKTLRQTSGRRQHQIAADVLSKL